MPARQAVSFHPIVVEAKGRPHVCPNCEQPGTLTMVGTPIVKNGKLKSFMPLAWYCVGCDTSHELGDLVAGKSESPRPVPGS